MAIGTIINEVKIFGKIFASCCLIVTAFVLSFISPEMIFGETGFLSEVIPSWIYQHSFWWILGYSWIFWVCMLLLAAIVYIVRR